MQIAINKFRSNAKQKKELQKIAEGETKSNIERLKKKWLNGIIFQINKILPKVLLLLRP